ncbi:MAG TPA: hypothetical protein VMB51_00280 [Solirubrobacteraceae bacterium]|nr:hypothetical protein [Solirubrobacteraceae bacterium]
MPEDEKDEQQTEETPKGLTVPVPKRDEFFGNLKKAAKPQPPKRPPAAPQNRGKGARRMQTPRGNARGK